MSNRTTLSALAVSLILFPACGGQSEGAGKGKIGDGPSTSPTGGPPIVGGPGTPGSGGGGGGIKIPLCADGTLDPNEQCDDGNTNSLDGCTDRCQKEEGFRCDTPGQPCVPTAACGDGVLRGLEACDDMNNASGDGCAADCSAVEPGWQCRVPGKKCVPLCGDGVLTGSENCDDSNTNSGDGCSSTCLVEPGWSCNGAVCTQAQCGNGMPEVGETCDKGAENGLFYGDATGCSKTCTAEPTCRDASGNTTACSSRCGDANIDEAAGEGCDDGNQNDNDGCSSMCQPEAGFTCTTMPRPDTTTCSSGAGQCLQLPVIFRDFDGENQPTGHPDFFYLGGARTCVPNASGRTVAMNGTCWDSDSTPLCKGIASATLGPNGKPKLGTTQMCACRFTDWDDSGLIPATNTCSDSGGGSHNRLETMMRVVQSEESFTQWYTDSDKSTKSIGILEMAQVGTDFQFSSSNGRTVYDDLHEIFMGTGPAAANGAPAGTLSSGFFPLEASTRPKLCNLWPYWKAATGPCLADDGNPVWQQWDPRGSYTAMTAGEGGPVKPVTGVQRNFYFTSEVRYLFRYNGAGTLAFYGDDDVWVYINGKLVLDLGAPHERLQGSITMSGAGATWQIQTTNIDGTAAVPTMGGSGMIPDLGLESGKTYEIVVFHADRHPRESNYQLTLSSFPTNTSVCEPRCGDGITTASEECDDGLANMDGVYGGCSTQCKFGPFCGDGNTDPSGSEQCDLGRMNGAVYGDKEGCTTGCQTPRYCGDGMVDAQFGERCDDGPNNGMPGSTCSPACTKIAE